MSQIKQVLKCQDLFSIKKKNQKKKKIVCLSYDWRFKR